MYWLIIFTAIIIPLVFWLGYSFPDFSPESSIANRSEAYTFINLQLSRQLQWGVAAIAIGVIYVQMLITDDNFIKRKPGFYTFIEGLLSILFNLALWRSLCTYPIIAYTELSFYLPRVGVSWFDNFFFKDISNHIICNFNVSIFPFLITYLIWQGLWISKLSLCKSYLRTDPS